MSNAFKREQDRYGQSTPVETPYQRAAQAWDDRIGSVVVQARNWRMMAFGCLGLALIGVGAFLYVQLRHPIAVYVVPVDRLGRPGRVELADRAYRPDQLIKAAFVRDFVEKVRSKSTDPVVLRQNWTRAKLMTNAAARTSLVQYGQEHAPDARLGQEAVSVEIASVLPRSPTTFQVQWSETTYLQGSAGPPVRWTGLFSLAPRPARTEADALSNGLGLEITSFQWSRDL